MVFLGSQLLSTPASARSLASRYVHEPFALLAQSRLRCLRSRRQWVVALIHQAVEVLKSADVQTVESLLQGMALGVISR